MVDNKRHQENGGEGRVFNQSLRESLIRYKGVFIFAFVRKTRSYSTPLWAGCAWVPWLVGVCGFFCGRNKGEKKRLQKKEMAMRLREVNWRYVIRTRAKTSPVPMQGEDGAGGE
jgi:hypothetical protein